MGWAHQHSPMLRSYSLLQHYHFLLLKQRGVSLLTEAAASIYRSPSYALPKMTVKELFFKRKAFNPDALFSKFCSFNVIVCNVI